MTTHVFIVDAQTFKIHLEYLFAGTGAEDKEDGKKRIVDFNKKEDTSLKHPTERMLVEMMADAGRIRKGDQIIFYLQQNNTLKINEGKFFGIFKAKHDNSFFDQNNDKQYLKNELGKSLTFRVLIEPYEVYAEGITEWEGLDTIKCIKSPHEMLWSLIYRKLKGLRGNTMITIYESERLIQLIKCKNANRKLEYSGKQLTFDSGESQKIICRTGKINQYQGRQEEIDILPRLMSQYRNEKAFEVHLQAYITQNLGKGLNISLDETLLNEQKLEWLGNEVSCGVGMQRIDLMFSSFKSKSSDTRKMLTLVELKRVEASKDNLRQIKRYVDWAVQYYLPNRKSHIQPILLTKKAEDKKNDSYSEFIEAKDKFNKNNSYGPLRHVEFSIKEDALSFDLSS